MICGKAGDFWRAQSENGLKVSMKSKKGAYQSSCIKGMDRKNHRHLRGLQGKQHFGGKNPVSV